MPWPPNWPRRAGRGGGGGSGEELIRTKAALPHGAWLPWLEAEFGWSDETARKFMRAAEFALKNPTLLEFQIDVLALYLLARPSGVTT
jgi:hypothetical protein